MKKKLCLICALILLTLGLQAAATDETDITPEYASELFDISWQISVPDYSGTDYEAPEGWYYLRFTLNIKSKSDEISYNVTPTVSFSELLKPNMTVDAWYNTPVTLYPKDSGSVPWACSFGWDALISKVSPGLPADAEMPVIFDCLLTVSWGRDVNIDEGSGAVLPAEEGDDIHSEYIMLRFDEMLPSYGPNNAVLTKELLKELIE